MRGHRSDAMRDSASAFWAGRDVQPPVEGLICAWACVLVLRTNKMHFDKAL